MITKAPERELFRRTCVPFANARSAMKAFLARLAEGGVDTVLLPAFIGWSPREGSGVFDPIRELGLQPRFYAVDRQLQVDIDSYEQLVRGSGQGAVVLLIHFYGYLDPNYEALVELARKHGLPIIEDEAHAMLTDLVGGVSGRLGDIAFFSLHKMLPMPTGGMLVLNLSEQRERDYTSEALDDDPWQFDLHAISRNRRANADLLDRLIGNSTPSVRRLRPNRRPEEVPQTYPILVEGVSRLALYERLNAEGFGVVSLYHTLIEEIGRDKFPDSYFLAERILNLPVHQDVDPGDLPALVDCLTATIEQLRSES